MPDLTLTHPRRRRRSTTAVAGVALLVGTLGLTGCGGSSSDSGTTTKIAITIKGDTITPKNKRIKVPVNKKITLAIDSDRAGELHLHSSPEQHIDFAAGTSTKTITLKVPGVVELEEHASDTLLAQLEAK